MALKKCPICGEKYSDTYKTCPFCEEEENLNGGGKSHRRNGRRAARGKEPNILSPILVIILLILLLLLFYMFFGQKLLHTIGLDSIGNAASSSEISGAASSSQASGSTSAEAPVIGENGSTSSGQSSVDTTNLPETLTLSSQDFTMKVGDAPVALKVTGGTGAYTWASDNESVATVDENGNVTAVSAGSANVTAADGTGKGTCIVRVKGTGTPNTGSSSGTLALSSTDFTLPTGDSYTLSVSGTVSSAVTWSSENSAVAAVSASGTVTGVGAGRTTIVATVNGTTLKCVVRVK